MRTKQTKRSKPTGAGSWREETGQEVQSMSARSGRLEYAREFLRGFFDAPSRAEPRHEALFAFFAYFYFARGTS